MKKMIVNMLFVLYIFSIPTMVLANSGPVYWDGYPSSDSLVIDDNTPILVESENLIFDFSVRDEFSYSINGQVTATYEMVNPKNEPQLVEMVFPFVGRVNSFQTDDIVIKADEEILSYDLYIGELVSEQRENRRTDFDFKKIVSTITNETYQGNYFKASEIGKHYIIDVMPTTDERVNIVVDFYYDSKKTKLITKGFNGLRYENGHTKITAWCNGPETLEIFVLGEDIDFKIIAYSDGDLREKTDLFTYETSVFEVGTKAFLMDWIEASKTEEHSDRISDIQLYNLYAKAIDQYFSYNIGYISYYDLLDKANEERILSLVYAVEFPPNAKKKVSVSYRTNGTMDMTKTVTPLYTFDYLLNPAKNWSDFKNLNIIIIPPEQAPHIVSSSIRFDKNENNIYIATLAELPEDDLFFTLYANEEITIMDKVQGNMKTYIGFLVFPALIILVIGGIIRMSRRRVE
ncbi:hypothetical protein AWH56_022515 [Anaerobacillus isosaccharinicus]|uniref:Uncharacterized protein n=1 Tax=Anaerobacillus isosaccharinicus TaxID=1532552 RepID=A0A1S2LQD0_9BACI|nr:hypothetical protein [Anaerobacillus isosaccharinicus]MBA5586323.1 hypothetical protein [Anaerobacillus isosaccharinicus]QOY35427.1 hypothetical protein AWH56_022515 [Anaerobacillus isosaccharinicus]